MQHIVENGYIVEDKDKLSFQFTSTKLDEFNGTLDFTKYPFLKQYDDRGFNAFPLPEDKILIFNSQFIQLLQGNGKVLTKFELQIEPRKEEMPFIIFVLLMQHKTYFYVEDHLFLVSPENIKQINFKCLLTNHKQFSLSTLWENHKPQYRTIGFSIEDKNYFTLCGYLFEFIEKEDSILIQAVNESLKVFSGSSIVVPGFGILSAPSYFNENPIFTICKPITSKLYQVTNQLPYSVQGMCILPDGNNAIASYNDPFPDGDYDDDEYINAVNNPSNYPITTLNPKDLKLYPMDLPQSQTSLVSKLCQYTPENPTKYSEFYFYSSKLYMPKKPLYKYRVIRGWGPIPDILKAPGFKEIEKTDIFTQIGAPIFCATEISNTITASTIGRHHELTAVPSIAALFGEIGHIEVPINTIIWIGIVEWREKATKNKKQDPHKTRWKTPIKQPFFDVVDGENIVASDPCDTFCDYQDKTKVSNCLGGKWSFNFKKEDKITNSRLTIFHEQYNQLLNEPIIQTNLKKLYEKLENAEQGMIIDEYPGWEFSGIIDTSSFFISYVTDSHYYLFEDIDLDSEAMINEQMIGPFYISISHMEIGDEQVFDELIFKEFSKLYSRTLSAKENANGIPGGVVGKSGRNSYPVFTKRVNEKAVCSFIALGP